MRVTTRSAACESQIMLLYNNKGIRRWDLFKYTKIRWSQVDNVVILGVDSFTYEEVLIFLYSGVKTICFSELDKDASKIYALMDNNLPGLDSDWRQKLAETRTGDQLSVLSPEKTEL
jgi:hypothetical protein